ncbi:hypothetical protein [Pseudonocardia nigra]|uniref:hypothetical protein n=1 Tax=Pseudonocardia nigra TaxID=1921578 RepID=UPI001C5CC87A|nr:hypothetical protein [Pseudonocardia nigra]
MYERERQSVGVVLTLHGIQDTAVVAHHADTDSAVVSVRIGRALIYLRERQTAVTFAKVWRRHSMDAARLPRAQAQRAAQDAGGVLDAGVVIDAQGRPPASGRLVRPPGQHSHLRIQLGRVVFDVRDLGAFASTQMAFRDAEVLSSSVLPEPRSASRREQAFDQAARALPPVGDTNSRSPRRAAAVAGAAPPIRRAPSLGQGWMQ